MLYLSQACQQESTWKRQHQKQKNVNVIGAFRQTRNNDYTLKYLPLIVLTEGRGEGDDRG